jgi:hypothetical protein
MNFLYFARWRRAQTLIVQCVVFAAGLLSQVSYAQSQNKNLQIYKCVIKFKMARTEVDKETLNKCMSLFNLKDINYIKIFTTNSPEGKPAYNQKLSEKRSQNIMKELQNIHAEIDIKHEGSSAVYGRQGIIVFIHSNISKPVSCPEVLSVATDTTPPVAKKEITKNVEVKLSSNQDAVYGGVGLTFLSSSLSKYTGNTMLSYNVGINHKLIHFNLLGGDSYFYIGGDFQFGNTKNTLSSTPLVSKTSVLYVLNNYSLIFGLERKFEFYKPLSLFVYAGPGFQERILILTDSNQDTEDADAARKIGVIGGLGVDLNFLEKSPTLEQVGMDSLFLRAHVSAASGAEMKTKALVYDGGRADLNQFSWSVFVDTGFTF